MVASSVPSAALFASSPAVALTLLTMFVLVETVGLPAVALPGGTGVVLAGALAGAGYEPIGVVIVMVATAVVVGDHSAYLLGGRISSWWERRRPRRPSPANPLGRWRQWSLAAMPSLAGAGRMPYRRFLPRVSTLRAVWFACFFTAGLLGAHSIALAERLGGPAAVLVSVVALASVLGSRRRRLLQAVRRNSLSGPALLLLALAAAWACGGVLQDATAHEGLARVDPTVARLLAAHVPEALARVSVGAARLAQTPGLYLMGFMCVMFLDLLRRDRSTWRFGLVAAGGALAAGLDVLLPSDAGGPAAQPGMAMYVGLLLSATLQWSATLRPRAAVVATVAAVAAVGILALALLLVGTPANSMLAGALAGLTWAGAVEASTRARWSALRLPLGNGPRPAKPMVDGQRS